jgi:glycolate oxidase iron-sulfur subunit
MRIANLNGLWRCSKCGACTAVCPLYQETVQEGMTARGKLALIEAVQDGVLQPSERMRQRLEDCLLCGACAQNCPSMVPTLDLFLEARGELADTFGVPLPMRLFLLALGSSGAQAAGMPVMRAMQRAGLARLVESGAAALIPAPLRAALRAVPLLPGRSFRARHAWEGDGAGRRAPVAYFAGCMMNWAYVDAAEATYQALMRTGSHVDCPPVVCCGMPHQVTGDRAAARALARENVRLLDGYETIVADCASCGAALKGYGELLKDDPALGGAAAALASRVRDVSQVLVVPDRVRPSRGGRVRVTYHEPCHLGRGQNVKSEPRELLQSIPGVEFVEMKGADVCCGGAGSFCFTHPDLSVKVGEAKVASILATGATVVASGCPSCMAQLSAMLRRRGSAARVCHPVELLAACL